MLSTLIALTLAQQANSPTLVHARQLIDKMLPCQVEVSGVSFRTPNELVKVSDKTYSDTTRDLLYYSKHGTSVESFDTSGYLVAISVKMIPEVKFKRDMLNPVMKAIMTDGGSWRRECLAALNADGQVTKGEAMTDADLDTIFRKPLPDPRVKWGRTAFCMAQEVSTDDRGKPMGSISNGNGVIYSGTRLAYFSTIYMTCPSRRAMFTISVCKPGDTSVARSSAVAYVMALALGDGGEH